MYINRIFELSKLMDQERFQKIFDKVRKQSGCLERNGEEYIDHSLDVEGVTVIYRDTQYKKKIKILVNSGAILGSNGTDPDKLIRRLDKCIGRYFGYQYKADDFILSGMIMTVDVNVGEREKVAAYLKVLRRIGRVKGFSPIKYDCFDEDSSFCLEGNSNGVEFMVYDLERAIMGQFHPKEIKKKELRGVIKRAEDILRIEIRLSRPKAIHNYTDAENATLQIIELSEKCQDIFLHILTKIIPYEGFYKKDKAVDIIWENIKDNRLRRRMLRLVALIPEKKSLYLAQKAMNYRNIEKVMEAFAEINVSPVTISKRQDVQYLKNIYRYLKE